MNCFVRMPIEEVLPIPMCRARLRVDVLSQTPMTSLVSWRSSQPQLRTDPWTLFAKSVNLVLDSTLDSRKLMNMMCKNNLAHSLQELKYLPTKGEELLLH